MVIRDDEYNNIYSKLKSKRKHKRDEFNLKTFTKGSELRKAWTAWSREYLENYPYATGDRPFHNSATVKKDFIKSDDFRWDQWKEILRTRPYGTEYDDKTKVSMDYQVKGKQNRQLTDNLWKTTNFTRKKTKVYREELLKRKREVNDKNFYLEVARSKDEKLIKSKRRLTNMRFPPEKRRIFLPKGTTEEGRGRIKKRIELSYDEHMIAMHQSRQHWMEHHLEYDRSGLGGKKERATRRAIDNDVRTGQENDVLDTLQRITDMQLANIERMKLQENEKHEKDIIEIIKET